MKPAVIQANLKLPAVPSTLALIFILINDEIKDEFQRGSQGRLAQHYPAINILLLSAKFNYSYASACKIRGGKYFVRLPLLRISN